MLCSFFFCVILTIHWCWWYQAEDATFKCLFKDNEEKAKKKPRSKKNKTIAILSPTKIKPPKPADAIGYEITSKKQQRSLTIMNNTANAIDTWVATELKMIVFDYQATMDKLKGTFMIIINRY